MILPLWSQTFAKLPNPFFRYCSLASSKLAPKAQRQSWQKQPLWVVLNGRRHGGACHCFLPHRVHFHVLTQSLSLCSVASALPNTRCELWRDVFTNT